MNRREVLISQLLRAASGVMVDDEKFRDLCRLAADALAEALSPQEWRGIDLVAKAEEQLAYWRKRQAAEKNPDDGLSEDGETYTPIGDEAAWQSGYCNGRMSEAEWWLKTFQYAPPTPPFLSEGKGAKQEDRPVPSSEGRGTGHVESDLSQERGESKGAPSLREDRAGHEQSPSVSAASAVTITSRDQADAVAVLTNTFRSSGMLDDPDEAESFAEFVGRHFHMRVRREP